MSHTILITGAGGYIGSVATSLFLEKGYTVVAVDSLVRGFKQPMEVLQEKYGADKLHFYETDIRTGINDVFDKEPQIEAVIHYAAFCNVGESEKFPEMYFDNNISSTLALLQAMEKHNVRKLVFSSTCSLYGEPKTEVLDESLPVDPTSHPYGESKYMAERIIN